MPKMRLSKNNAFTTVEAIVSLAISCSLILVALLKIDSFQQRLVFDNAIRQTCMNLKQASRVAAIKHEVVSVTYFAESGNIHFRSVSYQKNVKIDSQVKIGNLRNLKISKEGTISPRTLSFYNDKYRETRKIQMMWGKING